MIGADEGLINDSIKALFATGFFRDVEVRQDGDVLIVRVSERPAIATVEFSGNKDIKDEKIQEALLQVGVRRTRVSRSASWTVSEINPGELFQQGTLFRKKWKRWLPFLTSIALPSPYRSTKEGLPGNPRD